MSRKHPIISVTGSSRVGTTLVMHTFQWIEEVFPTDGETSTGKVSQ